MTPFIFRFLTALLLVTPATLAAKTLKERQLEFPRAKAAFSKKETAVKGLFQAKGVPYPPIEILVRAFKREKTLELWARGKDKGTLTLVKVYPVCASSGSLGPKREGGDGQVPEGFYTVSGFDPSSQHHMSLQVSYPNQSDKILGKKGKVDAEFLIHGECAKANCLSLSSELIEELYVAMVDAVSAHDAPIALHLFPARLDEKGLATLEKEYAAHPALIDFWRNLRDGFDFVEANRTIPTVLIGKTGKYRFIP